MKFSLISFILLFIAPTYAELNNNFLKDLATSVSCEGQIKLQIHNASSDQPMIEVTSPDQHFKIGDSFNGKLTKSSSCAYYFSKETMFYLCGLVNPDQALTFLDVQRVANKSSFSKDLVCKDRVNCIQLLNCITLP